MMFSGHGVVVEAAGVEWDAEQGVWVGERAPALHLDELPDPLFIFGYGSLIWRPGELLEGLESFHCTALGYKRLFAQRSCDHRGTARFPGVVLNLVSDEYLSSQGYLLPASRCEGRAWRVPRERAQEVVADLDYREKGGYHRHLLPVLIDGREVSALVYTGAPSNPNFYLPAAPPKGCDPFGLHSLGSAAVVDLIAAAVGPSGPNVDYLLNLVAHLTSSGVRDGYLADLSAALALRTGRRPEPAHLLAARRSRIRGWGSNEARQLAGTPEEVLSAHTLCTAEEAHPQVLAGGASSAYLLGDVLHLQGALHPLGGAIEGVRSAALGHAHALLLMDNGSVAVLGDHAPCPCPDMKGVRLLAAGVRHSLLATPEEVFIWGSTPSTSTVSWRRRISDACCGLRHSLLLVEGEGRVYSQGSSKHGALGRPPSSDPLPDEPLPVHLPDDVRFLRVTCGWSHAIARGVRADGSRVFYGWGRRDMGQIPLAPNHDPNEPLWRPRPLLPLPAGDMLEVWAGSEYTIAADTEGRLWGSGWNEHGNLSPAPDTNGSAVNKDKGGWTDMGVRLQHVWAGALACGGGHVLCVCDEGDEEDKESAGAVE